MSQGGTQGGSTIVGLPNNSTSPGMGGLGIGGGIYGNPFQVNQMSQPNALQGGMGHTPFMNQMAMGQMNQMNQMGMGQPNAMQAASPFRSNASMLQGQGAMLNQPQSMNYGLGSLLPGNYASRR